VAKDVLRNQWQQMSYVEVKKGKDQSVGSKLICQIINDGGIKVARGKS